MDALSLLLKLIVSFAIPFCWAFLLYPIVKKINKTWYYLLTATTVLSILLLILKEIFDNKSPLINDVAMYTLGLFFGSALLAYIFYAKNLWLMKLAEDNSFLNILSMKRHVPLQNILLAGVLFEEEGVKFYNMLAKTSTDEKSRELCMQLAKKEVEHKIKLEKWLTKWLPVPIESDILSTLYENVERKGIFMDIPPSDSSEEDMVKYALIQEKKMEEYYRSFKGSFPDAWDKLQIELLANEERLHAKTLLDAYPNLKIG